MQEYITPSNKSESKGHYTVHAYTHSHVKIKLITHKHTLETRCLTLTILRLLCNHPGPRRMIWIVLFWSWAGHPGWEVQQILKLKPNIKQRFLDSLTG